MRSHIPRSSSTQTTKKDTSNTHLLWISLHASSDPSIGAGLLLMFMFVEKLCPRVCVGWGLGPGVVLTLCERECECAPWPPTDRVRSRLPPRPGVPGDRGKPPKPPNSGVVGEDSVTGMPVFAL